MHYSTRNKNGNQEKGSGQKTFSGDFFKNLEKEFEGIFGFEWPGWQRPRANVKEYDDRYEVDLAVPGMEKKDFSIQLVGQELVVRSNRETTEEEINFLKREFDFKKFERRFTLSNRIDKERISASYTNGILSIRLFKAKKRERTINID